MIGPLAIALFRSTLAAGCLLLLLGTAPARAATIPVYYEGAGGFGVSQTTAHSASAAGIPIVTMPGIQTQPATLVVDHNLSEGTFNPGNPATIQSSWSATNNTG